MSEAQQFAPQPGDAQEQEKETGRIEAFSDGIFAVAITLLVLNIQVPLNGIKSESDLGRTLLGNWHVYLAFATSFATIGIMWINHHRMFTLIKTSNTGLLALNLLLLLFIVFVPFPTALFAQYLEPGYHLPAAIYSATFVVLAICFNLLWHYASHNNRLLDRNVEAQAIQSISRQYRWGPLLYLIAFVLAFLYPPASVAWNLALALFFAFPGQIVAQLLFKPRRNAS